ncbi:Reverse transcriptase (RNA-dependent DNA polymerase) [Fragilaria crotonensis]|nr:Reverse transcriptase (RNA-dependent DNA polymerase) [Fragilaria crotonensis]
MAENFRRKARLVANGNETDAPATLTYSSVVSRTQKRFTLSQDQSLDQNRVNYDYPKGSLRTEVKRRSFSAHLAETLYDIGYKPTRADPDVWIRPATKVSGFEYYEMVLVYVDDILCISADPKATMHGIQGTFKLKDDKIEKPETYLGAQLKEMNIGGRMCWTMNCEQYVKSAIANVEAKLNESGQRLPSKCLTPLQSNYRPELDTSAELKIDGVRYYQELIGVLRWAIELGRIDMATEVSMLSTHLALPREGHLQQVYHIFGYLKARPKRTIAFDPSHPDIDESRFVQCDWHDFYRGAAELIPGTCPKPEVTLYLLTVLSMPIMQEIR